MKIAIQGCTHGDLDVIYNHLNSHEKKYECKIDILICCGDFQAARNQDDLKSMACPKKYASMKDFHDYYSGRKRAPILTIFIGGNHEAANHLWELPYGGWVAENIYYLGYVGVVNYKGLRILGTSGIFNSKAYNKGHFEHPPFNEDTKRSFYYTRHIDIAKLKAMSGKCIDICVSHDWPSNIQLYGDVEEIYKQKPMLRKEPLEKFLPGNDGAEQLLKLLKPKYWFCAHHHCRFSATVEHSTQEKTDFLALSKCEGECNNFLEIIDIPEKSPRSGLVYDKDWLSILKATDHYIPKSCKERGYNTFKNIDTDQKFCPHEKITGALIELGTEQALTDVIPLPRSASHRAIEQTRLFCQKFGLTNPCDCYE